MTTAAEYIARKRAGRDNTVQLSDAELERLMSFVHVEPNTGCWLWAGAVAKTGHPYGLFSLRYRSVLAHRTVYQHFYGPVSAGLVLDHEVCDTPQCCNPCHVRPKTQRENLLRGDTITSRNAAKTACPKGHALTPDNLANRSGRICATCIRERDRRRPRRRTTKEPRP